MATKALYCIMADMLDCMGFQDLAIYDDVVRCFEYDEQKITLKNVVLSNCLTKATITAFKNPDA
jgi:hypothetical protein